VTAIRWLGVNDHSVSPGLGRPGRVLHPPRRRPARVAPKQPRNAYHLRQGPFARRARERVSTSLWVGVEGRKPPRRAPRRRPGCTPLKLAARLTPDDARRERERVFGTDEEYRRLLISSAALQGHDPALPQARDRPLHAIASGSMRYLDRCAFFGPVALARPGCLAGFASRALCATRASLCVRALQAQGIKDSTERMMIWFQASGVRVRLPPPPFG